MNRKQIILGSVLFDFAALTAWAIWKHGYLGLFQLAISSWGAALLFVDLTIALGLVLIWMMGDSRERGLSFVPYALLTLAFGSVGPLLYLIRRENHALAVPNLTPHAAR
ncbi:MAG TPA: DUF2834 domain-containing protein [Myxococcota bacterium]|jgi:hypothetical protein